MNKLGAFNKTFFAAKKLVIRREVLSRVVFSNIPFLYNVIFSLILCHLDNLEEVRDELVIFLFVHRLDVIVARTVNKVSKYFVFVGSFPALLCNHFQLPSLVTTDDSVFSSVHDEHRELYFGHVTWEEGQYIKKLNWASYSD